MTTTTEELKADESLLAPFREKLQELKSDETKYDTKEVDALASSDDAMGRFLVARKNDLNKAFSMAKATLEWRSLFKPSELTPKDFETAHSQGVWRFAGTTKDGCGILQVTSANWKSFAYSGEEYIKFTSYYMEQNLARHPEGPGRNFIIFDMANMSYFSDIRKIRHLARILNDYYPERAGHLVFVNCDWVFDKFFNMALRWVDKRTAEKCIDFRDNGAEYLLQYIDADQLTKELGGTREEEWPSEPLE